jgi:predicted 3-demethylubiquinone-9 3-methyltransferase (glyoxalase superfamily)
MTQDEIIEMAIQAKILKKGDEWVFDMSNAFELTTNQNKLKTFAKLVAEKEREACAKIADEWAVGWPHPSQVIAERIRERT